MVKKNKSEKWPKIEKGSHLTVYTYEDGSTKLEWDDEQLAKDVREAIASVEGKSKKVVAKKAPAKAATKTPAKKTKTKKQ